MRVYRLIFSISYLVLFISFVNVARADWPPQGTPVCVYAGSQDSPKIVSDHAGGAIIAWVDYRGSDQDIYVQRIDPMGFPAWTLNGVAIANTSEHETMVEMISDGAGGAFLAWCSGPFSSDKVYAQHITSDGIALWGAGGVKVSDESGSCWSPVLVQDGLGGVFIAWEDERGYSGDASVYAQRIDAAGFPNWVANGVALSTKSADQSSPSIIFDGTASAIVVFMDRDADYDYDVYAQKIDTSGTVAWSDTGMVVCTGFGISDQWYPKIVTDGAGGGLVTWQDYSSSDGFSARLVRIGPDGYAHSEWSYCGVEIADTSTTPGYPNLASDGAGGAIVAWTDRRTATNHIYAQKVFSNGGAVWQKNGIPVCTALGSETTPEVVNDLNGGAFLTWTDDRSGNWVIYAQWIDANGNVRWETNGVQISRGTSRTAFDQPILDPAGYLLVAFSVRHTYGDIYAQRIDKHGQYGVPNPHITGVTDVPHDQGGAVSVEWEASYLDNDLDRTISQYSIWRNVSPHTTALASAGKIDRALFIDPDKAAAAGWEWIKNMMAIRVPNYAYTASTLIDSTSMDPAYYHYIVLAHADDPNVFWMSEPDSGYSVDDLSPSAPQGLAGHENESPAGARLSWDLNTEADFSHYSLYRGPAEDFVPGPLNLLTTTPDTAYVDTGWTTGSNFYYKLSAVDIHENLSPAALLRPHEIIVAAMLQGFHAAVSNNSVKISWVLSELPDDGEPAIFRSTTPRSDFVRINDPEITVSDLTWTFSDNSCEPGVEYRYRVYLSYPGGEMDYLFESETMSIPTLPLTLYQNFPNPFNPHTRIQFFLPDKELVTLVVYNASGQLVRVLFNGTAPSGQKEVQWDGRDNKGNYVSSGVYFYTMRAGSATLTRKMVLLR